MLDTDLPDMFTIQVKRINEQVSRNSKRFPYDFSFQLSLDEWQLLKSQIATSSKSKGGKVKAPRVFTEHGIAMLASGEWRITRTSPVAPWGRHLTRRNTPRAKSPSGATQNGEWP